MGAQVHVDGIYNSIILSGVVMNAADADKALQIARASVDRPEAVLNMLSIAGQDQVMLKVRILEVDRQIIKQLGVNWNAVIGQVGSTQFILGSVATALSGSSPPYGFPSSFVRLTGTGTIGPIPYQLIVFGVFALGTALFVSRSRMGRAVTLIGYNRPAARWSGIRVDRTIVGAFMISAFMAAVAGILVSGYYNAARDDLGDSLLLPAITVVVLGGVDIFGGRGRIGGVLVATFVLGYLTEGLLLRGDSSLTATMVTGLLLIACLVLKFQVDRRNGTDPWVRLRARFGSRRTTGSV